MSQWEWPSFTIQTVRVGLFAFTHDFHKRSFSNVIRGENKRVSFIHIKTVAEYAFHTE
jgi:hypothetical protein